MNILITGATSGHGRHLAQHLANEGHTVLVHGRDPVRTTRLAALLPRSAPFVADFASLGAVRVMAAQVAATCPRLDVVVNNVGIGFGSPAARTRRSLSRDGHELRFAVNYLAPVLLTRLLVPNLRAAAPSRIVMIGSASQAGLDLDDVAYESGYDGCGAYRRSKLALTMATFDLAEQLAGTGVTANVIHPATRMDTGMLREDGGAPLSTVAQGADATLELITNPALAAVTGEFYDGTRVARAPEAVYRPAFRARLRAITESLLAGPPITT